MGLPVKLDRKFPLPLSATHVSSIIPTFQNSFFSFESRCFCHRIAAHPLPQSCIPKSFSINSFVPRWDEPLSRKRSSRLPPLSQSIFWRRVQSVNFLYWQYIYYFILYLLSSLIFLVLGLGGGNNVGFLNSLFLCISAGTGAGLNTVDLSTLSTSQQVILWLLIITGSHTFVFAGLITALRIKYKRRLNREKKRRLRQSNIHLSAKTEASKGLVETEGLTSKFAEKLGTSPSRVSTASTPASGHRIQICGAKVGLKQFAYSNNTEEELEMRYQAFSILSWVVTLYIILVQLCGGIALGWYISARRPSIPAENHINAWWSGIFLSASAFNNSGMSLVDANMVPFQLTYFVLLAMSALILLGNTIFPILLRIIIQCLVRIVPKGDKWQDQRNGLRLLNGEKSRYLCPYLFTRRELFWLAGTILIFNGIDWAAFGISAAENPAFTTFPVIAQVVDGLFQACAVRSGGFSVVSIPSLRVGVQATYILMMYISSFPISPDNVWEPEMVCIDDPLSKEAREEVGGLATSRDTNFGFLKRQISRTFTVDDFWMLSIFTWIIVVIETKHFNLDPVSYSVFNIVFEIISAYGCVGVSMGRPDSTTSFSGALRGGSQLLLCGVMLLGRTREARKGVMKGDWGVGASFPGMSEEEEDERDEDFEIEQKIRDEFTAKEG